MTAPTRSEIEAMVHRLNNDAWSVILLMDAADLLARCAEELEQWRSLYKPCLEDAERYRRKKLAARIAALQAERDEQARIIAQSVAKTRLIEAEAERDALQAERDKLIGLVSARSEDLNAQGKTLLDFHAVWLQQARDERDAALRKCPPMLDALRLADALISRHTFRSWRDQIDKDQFMADCKAILDAHQSEQAT